MRTKIRPLASPSIETGLTSCVSVSADHSERRDVPVRERVVDRDEGGVVEIVPVEHRDPASRRRTGPRGDAAGPRNERQPPVAGDHRAVGVSDVQVQAVADVGSSRPGWGARKTCAPLDARNPSVDRRRAPLRRRGTRVANGRFPTRRLDLTESAGQASGSVRAEPPDRRRARFEPESAVLHPLCASGDAQILPGLRRERRETEEEVLPAGPTSISHVGGPGHLGQAIGLAKGISCGTLKSSEQTYWRSSMTLAPGPVCPRQRTDARPPRLPRGSGSAWIASSRPPHESGGAVTACGTPPGGSSPGPRALRCRPPAGSSRSPSRSGRKRRSRP